ncbi:autotransporter outer membrane beta-barrel domain-containing protein [Cupriavidus sp. 2SB]|uniref:autotransporter outer membrane beta-barrel domain-containing protein n=1 Tax=Cupriavidus sp. 2SB TaxID=2502199 RepID=UPI0020173625|nr:autotransporter outer membrane beta-barrel domain-containing protein [Cupriavidus sp. 2SB]
MKSMPAKCGTPMPGGLQRSGIYGAVLLMFSPAASAVTVITSGTTQQSFSNDSAYEVAAGTSIVSGAGDAVVIQGQPGATLTNAGSLTSSDQSAATGVRFKAEGTFINQASGLVDGKTYGVSMEGSAGSSSVVNYGDISVKSSHAIHFGSGASGTIENYGTLNKGPSGSVMSSADGIYLDTVGTVSIINYQSGLISSGVGHPTYGKGIILMAGPANIQNMGTIYGYQGGIQSTTSNAVSIVNMPTGVIDGDNHAAIELVQNGSVTNSGSIVSKGAPAILLLGGNNSVVLDGASRLDGAGNVAIQSQGSGNTIGLTGTGAEDSDFNATEGNGFASLTAQAGSNWTLSGNAVLGGAGADALHVMGNLTLTGTVTQQGGGGTTIDNGAQLTLGGGGASGMVSGNIANDGTLVFRRSDNVVTTAVLSGTGTLRQSGPGAVILEGVGSTQGNIAVDAGVLGFARSGNVVVSGDVSTAAGATLGVGGQAALQVGNRFSVDGTLDVVARHDMPSITAGTAVIGPAAKFNLVGFTAPAEASVQELASTALNVIHTTTPGGLTGAFQSIHIGGQAQEPDYLVLTSSYASSTFVVGVGLAWYALHSTRPETANGVFTLDVAEGSFDVDARLIDQPANAATGWDGRTLTKAGPGTLQLSKANGYSGATWLNAGTLRAGAANVIAASAQLSIADGATFDLDGFDQQVNQMAGAGAVTLGSGMLTASYTSDGAYAGTISGSGGLNKAGPATLTLTADSPYTGPTTVSAGTLLLDGDGRLSGTSQVTVAPGAIFGGYGSVGGAVVNNGLLAVADAAPGFESRPAGGFTIGGALVNSGEIRMGSPVPASTLTVNGDYTGNNGRLTLYTALGGDTSATDRLIVRGNTAGQTRVTILNAGGGGAETQNGIRIVQVDGQSNGLFALDGRVVGGAYEYQLYQGSVDSPGDGSWYLRSSDGSAPPVPRPEPGTWLTNQNVAQGMFVHTLYDRVGLPDPSRAVTGPDGTAARASIGWARVTGGHADGNAAQGRLAGSADSALAQAGVDLLHYASPYGILQGGVMVGYGTATTHTSARNNPNAARGTVNGGGAGLYGTWHRDAGANAVGNGGPYIDTWFHYSRFDNTVKGGALGNETYSSRVWTGSIEGGWMLPVGQTSIGTVHLVPQVQVLYTDYSADDHVENNGTVVQSRSSGGWMTRLGARLFHAPETPDDPAWMPFLELNWWHNTRANAVAFNNVVVAQDGPGDRVEVKVGAQAPLSARWRVWGHLGYQYGNGGYESIAGQLGVRYQW